MSVIDGPWPGKLKPETKKKPEDFQSVHELLALPFGEATEAAKTWAKKDVATRAGLALELWKPTRKEVKGAHHCVLDKIDDRGRPYWKVWNTCEHRAGALDVADGVRCKTCGLESIWVEKIRTNWACTILTGLYGSYEEQPYDDYWPSDPDEEIEDLRDSATVFLDSLCPDIEPCSKR